MNKTRSGKKMSIMSTSITATMNGTHSLTYSSTGQSKIEQTTYMDTPTGGVTSPSTTMSIKTSPKCTGSTPTLLTMGNSIAVNSNIMTTLSINMPAIRRD